MSSKLNRRLIGRIKYAYINKKKNTFSIVKYEISLWQRTKECLNIKSISV